MATETAFWPHDGAPYPLIDGYLDDMISAVNEDEIEACHAA